MFELFECVALAIKEKGVRGVCDSVPGGGYAFDVACYAYKLYRERRKAAALKAELEKVAAATSEEAKKVAGEVARQVVHEEEGADLLWAVEEFLAEIPGALRESLKQAQGSAGPPLDTADDFAKLLARVPQFRGGPLEGGTPAATFVPLAAALEAEVWLVPLRGRWFARPAGGDSAWTLTAEVPGEVVTEPGRACRFAAHPDTTDGDLEKLSALAGLPGLEAIDLSGCAAVTDAGVMHLARLRGLNSVNLAGTQVTDSGVALLLARFPELEELSLAGAASVSEAAVPHLMRLRKLKSVALPPTADTAEVRAEFAKRRPGCRLG